MSRTFPTPGTSWLVPRNEYLGYTVPFGDGRVFAEGIRVVTEQKAIVTLIGYAAVLGLGGKQFVLLSTCGTISYTTVSDISGGHDVLQRFSELPIIYDPENVK